MSTAFAPIKELSRERRNENEALKSSIPLDLAARHRASWYVYWKRILEFTFALALLAASAPFILISMLLVKLTSSGPALYSQTRLGLDGAPFTVYKIRSMRQDAESLGAQWAKSADSRITRVGRVLRKLHIDELPQLWNVLRGEMSLIGPRPERPEFVPQLEKAIPAYGQRLKIRPGLTGPAQVQLPPDTNLESVRLKLAYDIWYIRNISLWLDVKLLAATAFKVFHVPFEVIKKSFRIPDKDLIVEQYDELITGQKATVDN